RFADPAVAHLGLPRLLLRRGRRRSPRAPRGVAAPGGAPRVRPDHPVRRARRARPRAHLRPVPRPEGALRARAERVGGILVLGGRRALPRRVHVPAPLAPEPLPDRGTGPERRYRLGNGVPLHRRGRARRPAEWPSPRDTVPDPGADHRAPVARADYAPLL